MKDVVVFCGRNALDLPLTRQSVLRVPEVSVRLKEAQRVLDQLGHSNFDMQFFVSSDDSLFMRNIKWKSLTAAIVQIGLYDRLLKRFPEPFFFIGTSSADSAVQVCAKQVTFNQLLERNFMDQSIGREGGMMVPQQQAPFLTGIALEQFEGFQKLVDGKTASFQKLDWETHDFNAVLVRLIEERDIRRVILVGPGNNLINRTLLRSEYDEVQVLDSIETDPLLNWFWRDLRISGRAVGFH